MLVNGLRPAWSVRSELQRADSLLAPSGKRLALCALHLAPRAFRLRSCGPAPSSLWFCPAMILLAPIFWNRGRPTTCRFNLVFDEALVTDADPPPTW